MGFRRLQKEQVKKRPKDKDAPKKETRQIRKDDYPIRKYKKFQTEE